MSNPRIIIVGLFQNSKRYPVTQASELAAILRDTFTVLTVSHIRNKAIRLADIIFSLFFKRNQYDIAIVQFYSGNSFIWQYIACKMVKAFGKKLIITIHGGSVPERIEKYPNRYLPILQSADVITCPSEYMIDRLAAYEIRPVLVENYIPLKKYPFYNKEQAKPVLLWMRAFSEIYNPEMAVRVVHHLKKQYSCTKMYMAGPDLGLLSNVKKLINQLQLESNIEIVGYLDFEAKFKYANEADIFISTNRVDNAPVTFIEMWAMGLPVISTNVGGVSYLISDKETGLLVTDNDDVAMANSIADVISSKSLFLNIINKSRVQVRKYDEDSLLNKWSQILMTV